MRYSTLLRAVPGAVFALLLQLAPAAGQGAGFVATFGNDANDCFTPATACRNLQVAHDAVSSGDKIIVLDSGNYSSVTITKSIVIAATGVQANLSTGPATGITIDANPDDVVDLDGLVIGRNFILSDNSGIEFIRGGKLNVRNCTIRSMGRAGIYVRGPGSKRVVVSDCTIAGNTRGIWVRSGHDVFLDRVTVAGNTGNGVRSQGSGTTVRIGRSTVTDNGKGLNSVNNGRIISFGNNAVHGNGTNGAPTAKVSLK